MDASCARPILASSIWETIKERTKDDQQPFSLRTGCESIDRVLCTSQDDTRLFCISCESDAHEDELLHSLIASHLLFDKHSTVIIIDTQGLNLQALCTVLQSKLVFTKKNGEHDVNTEMEGCLERLQIMRIFDVEGLMDAVAEIEGQCCRAAPRYHDEQGVSGSMTNYRNDSSASRTGEDQEHISVSSQPTTLTQRSYLDDVVVSEIDDSQGSSSDEPIDIFPVSKETPHAPPASIEMISHLQPVSDSKPTYQSTTTFLIVSSLQTIFSPVQASNPTRSNALLSSLFCRLKHLSSSSETFPILGQFPSHDHKQGIVNVSSTIKTVVFNACTTSKNIHCEGGRSVFKSTTVKPLFGKIVNAVDVHYLLHLIPRTREDSRLIHEDRRIVERGKDKKGEKVDCLEVLSDRFSTGTGKFGFFTVDEKGMMLDI